MISGDRETLRPVAADMLLKINVQGDVKWSRDLERVLRTPLDEELETRIHRMELVLNWLMSEETRAARTLQRLGAQPLKNMLPTLSPGQLPKPVSVPPRHDMNVSICLDHAVTIAADVTISLELYTVHSFDKIA